MSVRSRTSAVLAVLVTATVLSTGIAGVALADGPSTTDASPTDESTATPSGDAVVDNVTDRIETLETVEFTRTVESDLDGETSTSTQRIVADFETAQKRTETLESSYGGNTTTVMNETHIVTYRADDNTVSTAEYDSRGSSVLPQFTRLANESAVEYEFLGADTVAGRDVYLLDATPQRVADGSNTSLTVAVDAATYFPVQVESTLRSDRYNITATQTYSNVSINEDLPESAFELDVPEDATQPSFDGPEITSYDEHSALQSGAELSIPAAELPGGYEFDTARTIDGEDYYSASLTYTDGEDRAYVGVQDGSPFEWDQRDGYDAVSIGNETGYYAEYDDYAFLHVDSDGQSYTVYGDTQSTSRPQCSAPDRPTPALAAGCQPGPRRRIGCRESYRHGGSCRVTRGFPTVPTSVVATDTFARTLKTSRSVVMCV